MRPGAADGSGIGSYSPKVQAQSRENACVGLVHFQVFALKVLVICVERVTIFHGELPSPHHAEARAYFVPEFCLNLVKMPRKLPVASQLPSCNVCDDFLMCRAEAKGPVMAIFEAQQFRAILLPATGFLPEFCRLDRGHGEFHGPRFAHFIANDGLDFAKNPQTHRHPGIDPAGKPLDQPGAQHQFVADELCFGRGFFEGGNEECA